jgi:uncharacterized protein (TIGR00369 family)
MPADPPRRREASWEDPRITAEAARRMPGIEFLRAIVRSELPRPPIAALMGFELSEVEEGRAVFTGAAGEHLYNPIGMVHGGFAATLCDSAMGCAVQSTLPAGVGYTTLELKVNFVRALTDGSGVIRCVARVIHAGRTSAVADSQVFDGAGRLCAHATTTCLILRPGA